MKHGGTAYPWIGCLKRKDESLEADAGANLSAQEMDTLILSYKSH